MNWGSDQLRDVENLGFRGNIRHYNISCELCIIEQSMPANMMGNFGENVKFEINNLKNKNVLIKLCQIATSMRKILESQEAPEGKHIWV